MGFQTVGGLVYPRVDDEGATAIFVNSYTGTGGAPYQWHTVDLKAIGVPAAAKAAFLTGILIITHGTAAEDADLRLAVRAPGSTMDPGNYIGQTIEPWVGGGERSNMSTLVPLVNGCFEYYWQGPPTGVSWPLPTADNWPAMSSYGINLNCQAYIL